MSDDNTLTHVVEAETVRMKFVDRLISLFVSPAALASNIKTFPAVLIPLIIVTLLALTTLPLMPRYTEIQMRVFSNVSLERYGVDYFSFSAADPDDPAVQTATSFQSAVSAISIVVAYPISAFFSALGLLLMTKIARGKAKLIHYYSLVMHTNIIAALGALVVMVLCVTLDTTLDVTSLAAVFMPLGNGTDIAYNIFSSISVFSLWTTAIIVIGMKVINEWSTVKAVVVGLVGYAITIAYSAVSMRLSFLSIDLMSNLQ